MTGSKQGMSFTFHEHARIVAKRPGRFRADLVQLSTDNAPQQRLTVISNGVKVWTYRPGTRQYSVMSYKAFQDANDDVTTLGLAMGSFFLGDGYALAQGFQGITKDNSAEVLAALTETGVALSSKAQSLNGTDGRVYRMDMTKQSLTYVFTVDPTANALRRVELTGTEKGMQIAFHEDLALLTPLTTLPKDTFTFTPPPGTTKVALVPVDPF